jgi:hypothetical protein
MKNIRTLAAIFLSIAFVLIFTGPAFAQGSAVNNEI